MKRLPTMLLLLAVAAGAGCGTGSGGRDAGPGDATMDALETRDVVEAAADLQPADGEAPEDDTPTDQAGDTAETLPPLPTKAPLAVPDDPLKGTGVESCSLYLDERCQDGKRQECAIYDSKAAKWVDDPDPLLRRAFLFDRWRDLYNSPDGQAVDRDFSGETPPLTPEADWGTPDHFGGYWGAGDGGIWTGWSTVAAILRYSQTGTEADYERMEQQVRDMVTLYDVTGIPGYLCRYHYLLLPKGAPNTPDHILRWEDGFTLSSHDRVIEHPESIANLPDIYTDGITDEEGKVWKGTPMWHGRPSIDQNTGPMTSLPMAYDLLRDADLKARIAHHLTCYLKRLQRIEIIHLQQNKDLLEGLMAYFSAGDLKLDPDDLDLTRLDRIVGYVHRQVNSLNEDTLDKGCPDTIQLKPWRVIDAAGDTFLADLLELVLDMDTESERVNQIDHYYFPSIRGGDAMHLMHLAAIAYHFTGDDMYRTFLYDELIGNIHADQVARTAGAFDLPKWCKSFFGDQITYGPWWAFIEILGDCDLKTEMQRAFHEEMWDKLLKNNGNVDFDILYAGALPPDIAKDREQALQYALDHLPWMGGNGGLPMGSPDDPKWLDDPRRSYRITPAQQMAWVPDGVSAVCPTEQEINVCTQEISVMGITLPGVNGLHTYDCTGGEWECPVGDGQCVTRQASGPLPIQLRRHTDFLWQRNPFELGIGAGAEGGRQYAGSDYSEPYWNARRYGFITAGKGQVLAWKTVGDCP